MQNIKVINVGTRTQGYKLTIMFTIWDDIKSSFQTYLLFDLDENSKSKFEFSMKSAKERLIHYLYLFALSSTKIEYL